MRLKLISCEIFYREICAAVARSLHTIDLEFLPKGLHDIGSSGMLTRLQSTVDQAQSVRYDRILLAYGLCNNGIAGLTARSSPLIVPRAHDCISLFFGSRDRYLEYFNEHPGVFFHTTGWIERGTDKSELSQISIQRRHGMDQTYEELLAKYGEDNARYLWQELCDPGKNYRQITFIEMGIEPDGSFERYSRAHAAERNWAFEKIPGDMSLINRLVNGPWDPREFLVLSPGERVRVRYDDDIIASEPIPG